MKKFKNIKTGNIVHVNDAVADVYLASNQYVEVLAKPEKAVKAEKPAK